MTLRQRGAPPRSATECSSGASVASTQAIHGPTQTAPPFSRSRSTRTTTTSSPARRTGSTSRSCPGSGRSLRGTLCASRSRPSRQAPANGDSPPSPPSTPGRRWRRCRAACTALRPTASARRRSICRCSLTTTSRQRRARRRRPAMGWRLRSIGGRPTSRDHRHRDRSASERGDSFGGACGARAGCSATRPCSGPPASPSTPRSGSQPSRRRRWRG